MTDIHLDITGMTCSACSTRIENSLRRLDFVHDAAVSLATSSAVVVVQPGDKDVGTIIQRIQSLGYDARMKSSGDMNPFAKEARAWRDRFIVSAVLSVPLLLAMFAHFIPSLSEIVPSFIHHPMYQALVGTMLIGFAGHPFIVSAVKSIRHPNMDVLVSLGMLSAYLYSIYQLVVSRSSGQGLMHHGVHLHFDAIAMVATSITFGKWLEAIAKGNAMRSLTALNALQSTHASVIRQGQAEEQVPISLVRTGDLVAIKRGEHVPVDGIVEAGSGEVDESLLTGESVALARRPGDTVYAGTQLTSGALKVRASTGGMDTRLARLIALVQSAQLKKPKIQRQADLVGSWFVPIIVVLAIATFVWWASASTVASAVSYAMAVLLVACPCALGLATPISVLIGSSQAARRGIAFKEGSALETMSRVNVFIFDKTGTLTKGKPALTGIRSRKLRESQLLRLVASLERHVEHPLALAAVREANARRLMLSPAEQVKETPGAGVSGIVDQQQVVIGTMDWLYMHGVPASIATDKQQDTPDLADSMLHVAINGQLAGHLTFRDSVREDARATIKRLSRFARIIMSTGDREDAAARIARETGITHVLPRMLPERKLDVVLDYQRKGNVVAMVGDGANDAAAMAASNVGIVMAGGHDAAMQSGDVVLVGGKLSAIEDASRISRLTMRNIKQNLLLACLYNAVMIPLAITGQLDPRASCIAMAASSLAVVANSLRLKRLKLPTHKEHIRS